jgi:predicted nucleic acid-binding protein
MILVDTNVISETASRSPSSRVLGFLAQHPVVALSVVSVMELQAGVASAPPSKRARLSAWLDALLGSGAVDVIPIDTAIARAAGALRIQLRSRPVALEDLLIGATALARDMPLATRNVSHFERLGVAVLNPFGKK